MMDGKLRHSLYLIIIIMICSIAAGGWAQETRLTLHSLIEEARENNPDLRSLEHAWEAARARVPQAGALPDPTLSFNLLNLPVSTLAFNQEAMTGKQVMLMQMVPFPGKLGLKSEIAQQDVQVAQYRYQEGLNQLLSRVKELYYELFYVDKALETVQRNTAILEQFVEIAQTKYAVGTGLQQDVLRAQVEHSRMLDQAVVLQQRRERLEAQLNALLNRPQNTPLGKPRVPDYRPFPLEIDSLTVLAMRHRPLLLDWQARLQQAELQVRLAKKEYLPDFRIGLAYTQREVLQNGTGGADFVSALVTVDLPLYWWRKQKKQVQEARYREKSWQEKYRDVVNQVEAGIEAVWFDLKKSEERVHLYGEGILSQANQSLQSAIAGYQTDKVDFLTLLNNEITLFNFELEYYRALTDYHISIVRLEYLCGTDLFEHEIIEEK